MKINDLFFKKTNLHIFLLILASAAFQACSSQGASWQTIITADGTMISARGALGGLEAVPSVPMYSGDGGINIRLAVLAPQAQGEAPGYLPLYIQGLLNNNFNKFSAINLIDRQNLDRIISEQNLAANGRYSDNDFVRIGNLTNAQYFLFGTIQKLSGDRYSLQLSVTDSSSGVRRADFMKDCTLSQLEGRGALINEATAELLTQLGVTLTEIGLQTLLAGNTSTARAEAGLARGITAQAGGSEIEALFNYTQAITFDPSKIETLSRLNTLSSTISGGTISQKIVNDIQARDSWLNAFKETTRFFNDHPPFEIIFDPNLIQIGQTDYARRTANIGMRIALDPSQAGFDALNALLEGLEKTGRRAEWGFSGWPLMELSPRTSGTVVFGGRRSLSYKVDVALINENNKTIGNGSVTLATETIKFSAGDKQITPPGSVENILNFSNVKAQDLTPTLTIVIVAVNGISSRNLSASGYMKIETGNLERKEREAAERLAQQQAQALVQQGLQKYNNRNYSGAIADFSEAIRLNPNDAAAYFNRAYAYRWRNITGDFDRAIADYTQAIRINPNDAAMYYYRGNAYYSDAYNGNGNYDRAIADYAQAIRLNPNYANAYYYRGNAYLLRGSTGDFDRAIADYTQVIRLNPNDNYVYAYHQRGKAYSSNKDYDRAITDYTQAIRLNPNYAYAYNDRGDAYYEKRDYNRAIADYEAALRIVPNDATIRQKLDSARQARGR